MSYDASKPPRWPLMNDRGECTCDACTAKRKAEA